MPLYLLESQVSEHPGAIVLEVRRDGEKQIAPMIWFGRKLPVVPSLELALRTLVTVTKHKECRDWTIFVRLGEGCEWPPEAPGMWLRDPRVMS